MDDETQDPPLEETAEEQREAEALARLLDERGRDGSTDPSEEERDLEEDREHGKEGELSSELQEAANFLRTHRLGPEGPTLAPEDNVLRKVEERAWKTRTDKPTGTVVPSRVRSALLAGTGAIAVAAAVVLVVLPRADETREALFEAPGPSPGSTVDNASPDENGPPLPRTLLAAQQRALGASGGALHIVEEETASYRRRYLRYWAKQVNARSASVPAGPTKLAVR